VNIPAVKGIIGRRLLVNFRADPDIIQAVLPKPFRPKLHRGGAIVGVCLIRLEQIRPVGLPWDIGLDSENAAHRMAVVWDDKDGEPREGVFIPRRDTTSLVNHLAGGHIFPGEHHMASFTIHDTGSEIDLDMCSQDKAVKVRVVGSVATDLPRSSCFASLEESSDFFEHGCLGYSARHDSDVLDGLVLQTNGWHVDALDVTDVYSSYFMDDVQFPKGSVVYDHTLLMRDIPHEWHAAGLPI
jgi:hypothetical protein